MTTSGLVALLLVLVTLAFAGWGVRLIFRQPYSPVEWLLFYTAYLLARLLWRTSVSHPLSIGSDEGAIIVTNHRSSVDPFFIQLAVGERRVHWMVAKEFIQHPAFRWFLRKSQVISTSRTGIDTASIKQAIRYAAEGGLVGMFPEGRINRTDQLLLPVRPGAAYVALRARVLVVPCYISGAPYRGKPWSPLLIPARVHVVVGDPMDLSPYYGRENDQELVSQLTLNMMTAVARLAGNQEFQPELAGRRLKPTQAELDEAIAGDQRDEHAESQGNDD